VAEFAFYPDNENVIFTNQLSHGIQEITMSTADKVKITSLYLPSTESDKLLIYFHGNAGNIYHRIPKGSDDPKINASSTPEHTGADVTYYLPPLLHLAAFLIKLSAVLIPSQIKHIDPLNNTAFSVNTNQKITIERLGFLQIGESY